MNSMNSILCSHVGHSQLLSLKMARFSRNRSKNALLKLRTARAVGLFLRIRLCLLSLEIVLDTIKYLSFGWELGSGSRAVQDGSLSVLKCASSPRSNPSVTNVKERLSASTNNIVIAMGYRVCQLILCLYIEN